MDDTMMSCPDVTVVDQTHEAVPALSECANKP